MLNFLRRSKNFLKSKEPVCIVLGNESCDLDSAVCAVSLAYLYQQNEGCRPRSTIARNFLPILNIPKRDYPLKTEVQYILSHYSVTSDMLTFMDDLSDDFMNSNQFVLVDHHFSSWSSKAVAIFDHRPKDLAASVPDNCELHLYPVGSCATLISELFLNLNVTGDDEKIILQLLRSAIVLDTVNFSKDAARATPKDFEVCCALEEKLSTLKTLTSRDSLFDSLVKARADVSRLTAAELLRKDLKILTSNKDTDIKLAIPGFPLSVQEYILKPDADHAIKQFAKESNCSVILLMGMFVNPDDNTVHRDLGLIDISNNQLYTSVKNSLLSTENPNLMLEFYADCKFLNGSFYKQGNIKATRKQILPVVKAIMDL